MQLVLSQEPVRRRIKRRLVMSLVILSVVAVLLPAAPAGAVVNAQLLPPAGPGGATKSAELGVTLASSSPVKVNNTTFWLIGVTNQGPDAVTDVQVLWGQGTKIQADAAKVQTTFVGSGFTCQKFPDPDGVDAVNCTGGSLAPGASATIFVVGTAPNHPLTLTTEARVHSQSAIDTNPANNIAKVTTQVIP